MVNLPSTLLLRRTLTGLADSSILHASGAGKNIVILNTVEAARDLLDKRSANYSNR